MNYDCRFLKLGLFINKYNAMACGCQSKSKKQPTKVKQIAKPRSNRGGSGSSSSLGRAARRIIRRPF